MGDIRAPCHKSNGYGLIKGVPGGVGEAASKRIGAGHHIIGWFTVGKLGSNLS